ncbi:MAG: hypothetical protein HC836_49230 [Richelia sp. RM2_1_2]|nr:hypothetical protein [Richelia sp. RM2_1_2]
MEKKTKKQNKDLSTKSVIELVEEYYNLPFIKDIEKASLEKTKNDLRLSVKTFTENQFKMAEKELEIIFAETSKRSIELFAKTFTKEEMQHMIEKESDSINRVINKKRSSKEFIEEIMAITVEQQQKIITKLIQIENESN